MTPEEIRFELFKRRKQVNMAMIARSLGCKAIGAVIDRKIVSNKIMKAVAHAIERDKTVV